MSALLLLGTTACSTGARGGPNSFASVVIEGHTSDEIRKAAAAVFTSNYYVTKMAGRDVMVFEKLGSAMDNIKYGGWSPNEVTIRVNLHLSSNSDSSYLVSCEAFMVRFAGDRAFEDENRVSRFGRKPYQQLLEDVQARLDPPPPESPKK